MPVKWNTIVPVWAVAVVGGVLVGVLAGGADADKWLQITFAGSLLLTFCIQIGVADKTGFVTRVILSITGALAVLALATGIIALASAF